MNGFNDVGEKFVIDTNVIFMSLYNPESKAGKLIQLAEQGKIALFSPDIVEEELKRTLKKELNLNDKEIRYILDSLPLTWIGREFYKEHIKKTEVKHRADKPLEALSLLLNCRILTADKHFKKRVDINEILEKSRD